MVALHNIVDSLKVIDYKLYGYRPLFLNGSKDARSIYRLIEEIFDESIKQLTVTPELAKSEIAARLGVTVRTVERTIKKLVGEGRISYEHSSKGKGKYSILFEQNMQLPKDCLLEHLGTDLQKSTLMSLVTPDTRDINKINIANTSESLASSSAFSIAGNIKKLQAEASSDIKTTESSRQDITSTTENLSVVPEPTNITVTNSPCLLYSEQEVEDRIEGLTEDEQDYLSDEIAELADKWETTKDSELVNHLKTEFKKSKCNHYGNWLWEKAQREVSRAYVISLLEQQGYVYRNESNPQPEVQSSNSTIVTATTPTNTSTSKTSVKNVANSVEKISVKNVAIGLTATENSNGNWLPALGIGRTGQKCRCFAKFSSPDTIPTSVSLHARTHAYSRMREVKLIKLDKYNKYINFLTSLKNGSLSCNSIPTSNATNISTSYPNGNSIASASITTDRISETPTIDNNQTQNTVTTSELKKLAGTVVEQKGKQVCDTTRNTSIANTTNTTNISRDDNKLTKTKQNANTTKKAKGKPEEPTPEMIKRLESDRVSPKDFSLWKIVDGDHKVEQDNDGKYLLPNKLQNHPKSDYSFWDVLAYAQTQKSIDAPVGFSISWYYSGKVNTSSSFREYLKEKANSLIGAARKPTQPTPQQQLEAQKAKQEYEQQLAFENSKEQLWKNLSTDEQQSLLLEEIKELKVNRNFLANYEKLRNKSSVLEQCAINNVKTRLAKDYIRENKMANTRINTTI